MFKRARVWQRMDSEMGMQRETRSQFVDSEMTRPEKQPGYPCENREQKAIANIQCLRGKGVSKKEIMG